MSQPTQADNNDSTYTPPSQVTGAIKQAQGAAYQAIAQVSTDPSWQTEGEQLSAEGAEERERARLKEKGDATVDKLWGKGQSAYGMVTGDQDKMTEGNLRAEKAEWKSAAADHTVPVPSLERVKGKVESAVGMATGDVEKQKSGNIRAEKAEWTQG